MMCQFLAAKAATEIDAQKSIPFYGRFVTEVFTKGMDFNTMERDLVCIVCPIGCRLKITGTADDLQVSGNTCPKGISYAKEEITSPVRMICTTVKIEGGVHHVVPVKTDKPIPAQYKLEVVKAVNSVVVKSPVKMGDIIIPDLFGTGVNIVAERDM